MIRPHIDDETRKYVNYIDTQHLALIELRRTMVFSPRWGQKEGWAHIADDLRGNVRNFRDHI